MSAAPPLVYVGPPLLDPVKLRLNQVPNSSWKICGLNFFCRGDSFLELDGRLKSFCARHKSVLLQFRCLTKSYMVKKELLNPLDKTMEGIGRQELVVALLLDKSHFVVFYFCKRKYMCVILIEILYHASRILKNIK